MLVLHISHSIHDILFDLSIAKSFPWKLNLEFSSIPNGMPIFYDIKKHKIYASFENDTSDTWHIDDPS